MIIFLQKSTTYFYRFNNTIIKEVDNNPYLGLSISNDLKWTNQINDIHVHLYARKHLLQLDSFVVTLNIAQLNVEVQHIYIYLWSDRHLSMERSFGTHTCTCTKMYMYKMYLQSDIDKHKKLGVNLGAPDGKAVHAPLALVEPDTLI